jgi:hypothetical protein
MEDRPIRTLMTCSVVAGPPFINVTVAQLSLDSLIHSHEAGCFIKTSQHTCPPELSVVDAASTHCPPGKPGRYSLLRSTGWEIVREQVYRLRAVEHGYTHDCSSVCCALR